VNIAAAVDTTWPRRLPVVAIVGRPNVGKSTLFNRLVGRQKAIVDDRPGVTRDRNYAEAQWAGRRYLAVDTGGFDSVAEDGIEKRVHDQSRIALAQADVVIAVLDGKSGLNPLDREIVDLLRGVGKPVLFAVNKLDSRQRAENLYEFYSLGVERLYAISAEHGLGVAELLDGVSAAFGATTVAEQSLEGSEGSPLRVAVVGRPNVGKSTLVNRLLGYERSVVDAAPGTTRDALDAPFQIDHETCILIDTAGVRRRARIDDRIERFSVQRSLRTVDRGDLVIHVIDGPEGVTDQDAQILSYAYRRGKALLLAVNKWDLVAPAGGDPDRYRDEVYNRLAFLNFVPVVCITAATGAGIRKLLAAGARVIKEFQCRVSTSVVNEALQQIVHANAAPLSHGKAVKFYYATQTGVRPPTFTLFVNHPRAVSERYQRYLVHRLRENLELDFTPVKLILRARRTERHA